MMFQIGMSLVFLIGTIGSGVWLSKSGKPLNTIIFTLHKLLAVAMVVFAVLAALQWRSGGAHSGWTPITLAATGILVVILFATGAALGTGKPLPGVVLLLHRLATLLAGIATALVFWGPK